jgi:hypothetical protein
MNLSLRHIFLLLGIAAVIFSFIFFGRNTGAYDLLITIGLIVATISYLVTLFKKDSLKDKIIWTLIVIVSVLLQQLTEPVLIKKSYTIFISKNQTKLTKLNDIILTKKNGLLFVSSLDTIASKEFAVEEINQIHSLIIGTPISLIEKDSQKIFYRTYGMLDVENGIFYFYGADMPDKKFKHIYGNWFY